MKKRIAKEIHSKDMFVKKKKEIFVQLVLLIKINFLVAQTVIIQHHYKKLIEILDGFVIIVIRVVLVVVDTDATPMITIYAMIATITIFINLIAKMLAQIAKEL